MKKKVFGRKFSMSLSSRRALFRALVRAIAEHGTIVTTTAKAKSLQGELESLINNAKKADISARRRIYAHLANDRITTDRLFKIADLMSKRKGGYTRIVNLMPRSGDSAKMSRIELVEKLVINTKGINEKTEKRAEKEKGKKISLKEKKIGKKIDANRKKKG